MRMKSVIFLAATILISGCGQKGPKVTEPSDNEAEQVLAIGQDLSGKLMSGLLAELNAALQEGTLSYRRPRRLPCWPYNLFTMVHGRNREEVTQKVEEIVKSCGLKNTDHTILFSTRRFKQRGASYTPPKHVKNKSAKLQLVKSGNK